jgi:DNA-directed RNA polymerase subunit N (RpoN/RPB10)
LYRAATFAGIERYIETNEDLFKDKSIAILPINPEVEDDVKSSAFVLAHKELCEKAIKSNNEPFRCLNCGDYISENGAPLIEIDEVGVETTLGLVHGRCLRPIDRVLGVVKAKIFNEFNFLKDFDFQTWFKLVQNGQAVFGSINAQRKQILTMAWNPDGASDKQSNYCVKINLEDGSSRFVHHRGKVVRESFTSALEKVEIFNSNFLQSKKENDPWCYTSINEAFGKYSTAIKMKEDNEECLECVNAEVDNYTLAIEKAYSRFENYYAPVFYLLEKETGSPISFQNTIFINNNPLEFGSYIKNWKKAGIQIVDYKIEIIKSDHEFDLFLMKNLGRRTALLHNSTN